MPRNDELECSACEGRGWVEYDTAGFHTPPEYERLKTDTCSDCRGDGKQHCAIQWHLLATREIIVRLGDAIPPKSCYVSDEGRKYLIDIGYDVIELFTMTRPTQAVVLRSLGITTAQQRML